MVAPNHAGVAVITTGVVLNAASLVALGLRFWAMNRIRRPMKMHDYLCIISSVGRRVDTY